jgi:hypothetical protein
MFNRKVIDEMKVSKLIFSILLKSIKSYNSRNCDSVKKTLTAK